MFEIEKSMAELRRWFGEHPKVLVAFSGGVDSCLVAFLARRFLDKDHAVAVISNSASLKASDLEDARRFCEAYDIQLHEIDAGEINDPNYRGNPIDRCFHCKTSLYQAMWSLQQAEYPGFELLNGNNRSDQGDYRPGMVAADDQEVRSPLLECGVDKEGVRALAQSLGLFTWDKPASPCLSSRFPYGEPITIDKLRMVELGEDYLKELGFSDCRVRIRATEATVEVPRDEVEKLSGVYPTLQTRFREIGFDTVSIDPEGLVSGKLNRGVIHGR